MPEDNIATDLEAYTANFDPHVFIASNSSIQSEYKRTVSVFLHETFSGLEPGERLVDVGSGPGIWNVLSASAKFQSITLSDPLPQNTRMLQRYLDDVSEDERWREHFQHTAQLEGDADKWPEVAVRMRARSKHVVWCDILQDAPLGRDQPQELFDCALATFCLTTATAGGDAKSFARSVKNLVSLVKPGGHVVILDGIEDEGRYYKVGAARFGILCVREEELRASVEAAGCEVVSVRKVTAQPPRDEAVTTTLCVLLARKL
jgi:SAM-dependent methyltransferase